jgi:hypothetical protein
MYRFIFALRLVTASQFHGDERAVHAQAPKDAVPKEIDAAQAIKIAEQFVRENGYTDFVPQDASLLTPESIEFSGREEWVAERHDTLVPRAVGYLRRGKDDKSGWTVGFKYVKPSEDRGAGRAVTMDKHGKRLVVQHKDLVLKNLVRRPE